MKVKFLILLSFFAPITALAQAVVFVGSSGDGFLTADGEVYLYDFLSLPEYSNPWVGKNVDGSLGLMPFLGFPYPVKLLANKLNDLNQISPGLGNIVLMTLNSYQWGLINEQLSGEENIIGGSVLLPAGAKPIRLANRLGGTIIIQKDHWLKMNEANQVGLLIHEAVSALLRPIGGMRNIEPSVLNARNITSALFIESNINNDSCEEYPDLNIPDCDTRKSFLLPVQVGFLLRDLDSLVTVRFGKGEGAQENFLRFWTNFCASKPYSRDQDLQVDVQIDETNFRTEKISYMGDDRTRQYAIQIRPTKLYYFLEKYSYTSEKDCRNNPPPVINRP